MLDAIVIGNDHYNTLNVIRSLGKANIRVFAVIISNKKKSFVLKSRYVNKGYIIKELDCRWLIEKFADNNIKIPIISSADSVASDLDLNLSLLSQYFVVPSIGNTQGLLTKMMNKEIQSQYAKNIGFDVPVSISVDTQKYNTLNINNIHYPCIIKPEESIGGSKNDFRICSNKEQLLQALQELSNHLNRVLIQDYISKDEEIVIAGVRDIEGKNYLFGEIKKEKYGVRLNNMGLTSLGALQLTSEINDCSKNLLNAIDFHGCYSIEVIRSGKGQNRRNYFMEINFRTDATICIYTKANLNFPAIWVKSCYGEEIDIVSPKKIIYGMNEFLYFKNGPYKIKDLIKSNVFSTFSLKDIKPFIFRFLYHG